MHILLIATDPQRIAEARTKLLPATNLAQHELSVHASPEQLTEALATYDCIIDLDFDQQLHRVALYAAQPAHSVLLLGAATVQLAQVFGSAQLASPPVCAIGGLNNLPTFLEYKRWEVSCLQGHDQLSHCLQQLALPYSLVADRVGMVTPRVVAMIINEACFTLQEATATIADIDKAMKLGTNYPYGPFEWANRIGIAHVYRLLLATYHSTHDERYRICPLLQTHFYRNLPFEGV